MVTTGGHRVAGSTRTGGSPTWLRWLGRAGLAAKGVVYGVIGLLAADIARSGSGGAEASATGAIETVARQRFGQVLLALLTLGLLALAAWRAVAAWHGDSVEGSKGPDRARYAAKALVYVSAALTAGSLLAANLGQPVPNPARNGGGDEAKAETATTVVLGWPGGRWLVGLLGLALIGLGAYVVHRRVAGAEIEEWMDGTTDGRVRSLVVRAGRAGYAAWAATAALIGVLLIRAAVQNDPKQAGGVSGALQSLGGSGWGQLVLLAIAAGLVVLGLFYIALARVRRM